MADGAVDIDLYADDLESEFNQDGFENEGVDLYDDVITASSIQCEDEILTSETSGSQTLGNTVSGSSSGVNNYSSHNGKKLQIYVGNLTWWTRDQDVADALANIGIDDLIEVKFYENRANGQSKGFCVVTLGSETSVRHALERLPKKELHGQLPVVTHACKQALSQFEAQSKTRPSPQPSNHQGSSSGNSSRSLPSGSSRLSGGPGGIGRDLKNNRNSHSGSGLLSSQKLLGPPPSQGGISQRPPPYGNRIPFSQGPPRSLMSSQGPLSVMGVGSHKSSHPMNMAGQMSPRGLPDTRGPPPRPDWNQLPGPPYPPPLTSVHPLGPPPRVPPPPTALPPHLTGPPPQSLPAPHVNPAFLPPHSHPPPLIPPPVYGAPPPVQPVHTPVKDIVVDVEKNRVVVIEIAVMIKNIESIVNIERDQQVQIEAEIKKEKEREHREYRDYRDREDRVHDRSEPRYYEGRYRSRERARDKEQKRHEDQSHRGSRH